MNLQTRTFLESVQRSAVTRAHYIWFLGANGLQGGKGMSLVLLGGRLRRSKMVEDHFSPAPGRL